MSSSSNIVPHLTHCDNNYSNTVDAVIQVCYYFLVGTSEKRRSEMETIFAVILASGFVG